MIFFCRLGVMNFCKLGLLVFPFIQMGVVALTLHVFLEIAI